MFEKKRKMKRKRLPASTGIPLQNSQLMATVPASQRTHEPLLHLLWSQAKPSLGSSKQEATAELGDTNAPQATRSASPCCRHSWKQLETAGKRRTALPAKERARAAPSWPSELHVLLCRRGSTLWIVFATEKLGFVYSIVAKTLECFIHVLNHGPFETKFHLVRSKTTSRYYQAAPCSFKVQFIPAGPEAIL